MPIKLDLIAPATPLHKIEAPRDDNLVLA